MTNQIKTQSTNILTSMPVNNLNSLVQFSTPNVLPVDQILAKLTGITQPSTVQTVHPVVKSGNRFVPPVPLFEDMAQPKRIFNASILSVVKPVEVLNLKTEGE